MRFWLNCWIPVFVLGLSSVAARASDIVDTAVGAGKFKTLATALGAAKLVDTLKSKGPFTVFAPTDEAFAKLPKETIAALLKPENRDQLAGILTYHVVPGKVLAKDVVGLKGAVTVNGQRIDVVVKDGSVTVDGANVVTTDIQCDNGVIHVIDAVILPASKTIPETAKDAGIFETLLAAAKAAGLAETLSGPGPFTILAPNDDAFSKLPEGTVASLLKPENKEKLVSLLKYHVVSGRLYSEEVLKAKSATTLLGTPVTVSVKDDVAKINDSKILATDIDASNGVIHVIDSVLQPPPKLSNARQKLEKAVAKGAPLFNAGHHAACASIYHDTMTELMSSSLSPQHKTHLTRVLSKAEHTQCSTERAWVLRRGIDQMYTQLTSN